MTGTIRTLKEGYGFIAREGETKDLFFHFRDMQASDDAEKDSLFKQLKLGDAVNFEVVDTDRGPAAKSVAKA
jgi:cold shock protein